MDEEFGIILLDHDEVIIRIYIRENPTTWQLVRILSYDLATFQKEKPVTSPEIIERIADVSLSPITRLVTDWKIIARNLSEPVVREVSTATGIQAEMLTLAREQEFLCKGLLMELQ